MSDFDRRLGWLEGIIDGEGSLGLRKNNTKYFKTATARGFEWEPRLEVSSTTEAIILTVRDIVGEGYTRSYIRPTPNKKVYKFVLAQGGLRKLLPVLHLVAKEEHRILMLQALKLLEEHKKSYTPNDDALEAIYLRLRELNWRGFK